MIINAEEYNSIIFDLGGVLLNIDYHKTINKFKSLGLVKFDSIYTQFKQDGVFDKFERGEISNNEFRDEIIKNSGVEIPKKKFEEAWNSMLLDFPPTRIALLEKLAKTHRIFLLSNTNKPHIVAFKEYLNTIGLLSRFNNVFEKIYFSYEMGMRKPETRIFEYVINENKLNKEKTIFIDDSFQHIEGAIKTGIDAFFLKPEKCITEVFTKI